MEGEVVSGNLFGMDGWENLEDDVASVWERIECDLPEPGEWTDDDRREWEVIEWTAKPLGDFLTPTWRTLERISEDLCDYTDEWGFEHVEAATAKTEVIAAFEYARALLASHLTRYRMAEKQVTTHIITLDEHDQPLVNGEPMYITKEAGSA